MKYSKVSGAVRWSGGTTILRAGQSADDDHPLVVERPDLWTSEGPGADLRARRRPVVERATRAPGEVRDTPRRGPGRPRKVAEPAVTDQVPPAVDPADG